MITEGQILNFCDALEKRVQQRDSSYSVRVQSAQGMHGPMYLIHIENATDSQKFVVDSALHTFIREYN
jgi:hypothetical protein